MSQTFTKAHGRVLRAFWQDGLLDVVAGVTLICIAIAWITGNYVLGTVAPAFAIPTWSVFRKWLVAPRLGNVRFDQTGHRRVKRSLLALYGIGCLCFVFGIVVYWITSSPNPSEIRMEMAIPALPAVLVGVGGWLCAVMFGINRLAIYGAVCIAAGVSLVFWDLNPGWSLLVGGIFTSATGILLIIRFINRFPQLPAEME